MTVIYSVIIEGRTHEIRVSLPFSSAEKLETLKQFAVITACLERAGYLPPGAIHAMA